MLHNNEMITMRAILERYTNLKIENLVNAANELGIKHIWNEDSFTSPYNAKKIVTLVNKRYQENANKNNPNFKQFSSKNALVIDYLFASYLFGEDKIVDETIKNIKRFKIQNVCIVLDDSIYAKYSSQCIQMKKYCNSNNITIDIKEVARKNTYYSKAPRADLLVAKKLGEFENMKYDIYLLSGDSDFTPVVADIKKSKINLLYSDNLNTKAKYSRELKDVIANKKNGHIEYINVNSKTNVYKQVLKNY